MTTTLELPDDVMLRVKQRAEREHKQINEVLLAWIKFGFHAEPQKQEVLPPLGKLKGGYMPTVEEIIAAKEEGRDRFDTFSPPYETR